MIEEIKGIVLSNQYVKNGGDDVVQALSDIIETGFDQDNASKCVEWFYELDEHKQRSVSLAIVIGYMYRLVDSEGANND